MHGTDASGCGRAAYSCCCSSRCWCSCRSCSCCSCALSARFLLALLEECNPDGLAMKLAAYWSWCCCCCSWRWCCCCCHSAASCTGQNIFWEKILEFPTKKRKSIPAARAPPSALSAAPPAGSAAFAEQRATPLVWPPPRRRHTAARRARQRVPAAHLGPDTGHNITQSEVNYNAVRGQAYRVRPTCAWPWPISRRRSCTWDGGNSAGCAAWCGSGPWTKLPSAARFARRALLPSYTVIGLVGTSCAHDSCWHGRMQPRCRQSSCGSPADRRAELPAWRRGPAPAAAGGQEARPSCSATLCCLTHDMHGHGLSTTD